MAFWSNAELMQALRAQPPLPSQDISAELKDQTLCALLSLQI